MLIDRDFYISSIYSGRECLPEIIDKNKTKEIKCDFVLNHQDYDTAVIEAPEVPDSEIRKAISWEAVKVFGDGKLRFDFYHLPLNHQNYGKLINVVAVEEERINDIKERSELENVSLCKITIPEIIYKSAKVKHLNNDRFCMVIANKDIGKLVIVESGEICFSRKFNLSYSKEIGGASYESILLLELQRSLDYCERQYRIVMPAQFFVVGDAVNTPLINILKDNVSHNIHTDFSWDKAFEGLDHLSSDYRFLLSSAHLHGVG